MITAATMGQAATFRLLIDKIDRMEASMEALVRKVEESLDSSEMRKKGRPTYGSERLQASRDEEPPQRPTYGSERLQAHLHGMNHYQDFDARSWPVMGEEEPPQLPSYR